MTPGFDHEKLLLHGVVAMTAGLIARFSGAAREDEGAYGSGLVENENE